MTKKNKKLLNTFLKIRPLIYRKRIQNASNGTVHHFILIKYKVHDYLVLTKVIPIVTFTLSRTRNLSPREREHLLTVTQMRATKQAQGLTQSPRVSPGSKSPPVCMKHRISGRWSWDWNHFYLMCCVHDLSAVLSQKWLFCLRLCFTPLNQTFPHRLCLVSPPVSLHNQLLQIPIKCLHFGHCKLSHAVPPRLLG